MFQFIPSRLWDFLWITSQNLAVFKGLFTYNKLGSQVTGPK